MSTARHHHDEPEFEGGAKVYQLDQPLKGHTHVVISIVDTHDGPVTFVFPAGDDGELLDSGDALHAFSGHIDHADALARLGYMLEQGA